MSHAPGHLRDAFQDLIDQEFFLDGDLLDQIEVSGKPWPVEKLLGQLWQCTDVLPVTSCAQLDLPQGSTYAAAVQHIKATARNEGKDSHDR